MSKKPLKRLYSITDPHTINSWMDSLVVLDYLQRNPHTSLSAIKEVYKPTPETRYYTNSDKMYLLFDELRAIINKYYMTHPHTKQTNLSCDNIQMTNESESISNQCDID